jgi:hypothetical protein
VDFDLDEYNGRYCVTPEFPGGTYAYFVAISSNGTPVYPYNLGFGYYGDPIGGNVSVVADTVVTNFLGHTNLTSTINSPTINNGSVTLTWSALEGGSYQVEASTNLTSWTVLQSGVSSSRSTGGYTNATSLDKRFYRVGRTSLANFDSAGTTTIATPVVAPGGSASRGQTVYMTITLPASPPNPPVNATPTSVYLTNTATLWSLNGTSISHPTTNTVTALFVIPTNAPVSTPNVMVIFNPNPAYTISSFTIN